MRRTIPACCLGLTLVLTNANQALTAEPAAPAPPVVAPAATPKWIPLFNGTNLDGWTVKIAQHPLGANFADTFRVEDGVIKVAYDKYGKFDEQFGHLYTNLAYSRYILRLEYRFTGSFSKHFRQIVARSRSAAGFKDCGGTGSCPASCCNTSIALDPTNGGRPVSNS